MTRVPRTQHPLAFYLNRVGLCAVVFTAQTVWAQLNFQFTYEAANSNPPTLDGVVDQSGALLTNMMNAAASIWSDLIEDDWTINVALRWQVPTGDSSHAGQTSLYPEHRGNINADAAEQNSRTVWALVRLNPNHTWWADPTPLDHSEFDLTQTLYRDLTPAQQSAGYRGGVPSLLEVGFRGGVNANAPALMQASGTHDLLTAALHELGHTVGVGTTAAALLETGSDGDYDVDPGFVNGANLAVLIDPSSPDHLTPPESGAWALMCPCDLAGLRVLPSAVDVFAAAQSANWTDLDLNRQDFLGGEDWHLPSSWEGGAVPMMQDHAFVRDGSAVALSDDGRVSRLLVSGTSSVETGSNRLSVDDTATIEHNGVSSTPPRIVVENTGELDAVRLAINGGELQLDGGLAHIHDGFIVTNANGRTGRVIGHGTIELEGGLANSGTLAPSGGTLTITAASPLDLDGPEQLNTATLDATDGSLTIDGQLSDAFDGQIVVGPNQTVGFSNGWELGGEGVLNFQGTIAQPTSLSATVTSLAGRVNVDGLAQLESTTIIDGAQIHLAADTVAGILSLAGQTLFAAGSTQGTGTLRQDGDATVIGEFSIANAVYDWDGTTLSTTTITPLGRLFINSSSIDSGPSDGHDGRVNVEGGFLSVDPAWRVDGELRLVETGSNPPVLAGEGGVTIHTTGQLVTVGDVQIDTSTTVNGMVRIGLPERDPGVAQFNEHVTFGAEASVSVQEGSILSVNDSATYRGGRHDGGGMLRINGEITVVEDTIWDVAALDWDGLDRDGATAVSTARSLTINANTIKPLDNTFGGTLSLKDGSAVSVNTDAPWALAETAVLLFDAEPESIRQTVVSGNNLDNRGLIEGNGRLRTTLTNQSGTLRPGLEAGALRIDTLAMIGGTLELELGGTTAVSQHDQLQVTATATLGGVLELDLIDGFTPSLGDLFQVLTAGERVGVFDRINGVMAVPGGLALAPVYDFNGQIGLSLITALPGDADLNGVVALGDLGLILDNLGNRGDWMDADFNGDGAVALGDLGVILDHLGRTSASPPSSAPTRPVPEPATAVVFTVALYAALSCRAIGRRLTTPTP